jgi:hypothetical protein
VRVAGPTGGDALLSDELPRARPVDHAHPTVLTLTSDFHVPGQEEVHRRRGLALLDEVGLGREPLDVDEVAGISEPGRLAREDPQCAHEVIRALEAGRQIDDPFGQTVAEQHPASRRPAVEESDRSGGSQVVARRGDGGSHRHVVRMAGEPVGCEGDHHVGL